MCTLFITRLKYKHLKKIENFKVAFIDTRTQCDFLEKTNNFKLWNKLIFMDRTDFTGIKVVDGNVLVATTAINRTSAGTLHVDSVFDPRNLYVNLNAMYLASWLQMVKLVQLTI